MNKPNPKVDALLKNRKTWQAEMTELRSMILDCGLTEDVKWRWPCYTLDGKNVVLINAFKEYCSLLFMKGALLKDSKHILVPPGQAQSSRLLKVRSVEEVRKLEPVVKAYVREAIDAEKSGLRIKKKTTADYEVADEFKKKLAATPALKKAFAALTPGRQRGYLLYFSGAKQAATREARVEKCMRQIMEGKGVDE